MSGILKELLRTICALLGVYPVKLYGSDPTLGIMGALAAATEGGLIWLGAGTLEVRGIKHRPAVGVTIKGAGKGSTTLKLADGANATTLYLIGGADVTVCDLTIDGSKASNTTHARGLLMEACVRPAIRNVRVTDTVGEGIYCYRPTDPLIDGCEVDGSGKVTTTNGLGAGILLHQTVGGRVLGNTVVGCNDTGILLAGAGELADGGTRGTDVTLTGNTIRGCTYIGIALGGGNRGVTVTANTVRDCLDNGIDTGSCSDVTVTSNVIRGCGAGIVSDGSTVKGCRGHAYSANVISDSRPTGASQPVGISVLATNDVAITASTTRGCGSHGIQVGVDCGDFTVSKNVCANNGQTADADGINVYAATAGIVLGNRCYDDQTVKTQNMGYREAADAADVTVTDNDFRGNADRSMLTLGGGGVVRDNRVDDVPLRNGEGR